MKNLYIIFAFLLLSCGSTIVLEDNAVSIVNDNAKKTAHSGNDTLWYHPNPWWKVVAEPFPVSADSFKIRAFFAQYGLPKTFSNGKWSDDHFKDWMKYNQFSTDINYMMHFWFVIVNTYKDTFQKHPEYLAEINGKRPGYGKASKFCVTQPAVANLYADYIFNKVKETGNSKMVFSLEPSDGGDFCTCTKCKALGSTSNQVYFFANKVAEKVSPKYPEVKFNLLAYYNHSIVPDFKLHKNITITVVPNGFQNAYSPEGIIKAWSSAVRNPTMYDYFGIPQWTGDMPRIRINDFLEKVETARKYDYDGFMYESAVNLNATILLYLWNRKLLSPETEWETIFSKFISDCFPSCKEEMYRLFNRWQNIWLKEAEIPLALYDLKEAEKKVNDPFEKERLRDVKAYLHYMILYLEWDKERLNLQKTKAVLNYIFESNNRITSNYNGISEIVTNTKNIDTAIKNIYKSNQVQKNIKLDLFLTNDEIERNFKNDVVKYPPQLRNIDLSEPDETIKKWNLFPEKALKKQLLYFSSNTNMYVYSKDSIEIQMNSFMADEHYPNSNVLLSIQSKNGAFYKEYFIEKSAKITIKLPAEGLYQLNFNRVKTGTVEVKGTFIFILEKAKNTFWTGFKYYYPDEFGQWQLVDKNKDIPYRKDYMFMFNKP